VTKALAYTATELITRAKIFIAQTMDTKKWRKKHEGPNFSKLQPPYLNDRLAENLKHWDKVT
jgi:hypothetical protein